MPRSKRPPAILAASLAILTALFAAWPLDNPTLAHHTYVTKYNSGKVITLHGVISSVDYRNPHIFFDLDVTYKNGSTATWHIETESIAKAQAKGLTQNALRQGAKAVVVGWPARDGSGQLGLKSITVGGRTYSIRRTAK